MKVFSLQLLVHTNINSDLSDRVSQAKLKSIYGPLWRWRLGPYDLVSIASPDLLAHVVQQEGRYPIRAPLPHWKAYRDLRGQAYGLHVE